MVGRLNSTPLVTIAVVSWNSARYLDRCLAAIAAQTHPRVEVIAVDNASSDGSIEILERHDLRLIRNDTNRGYSAAVNQALAHARGGFLLVVNPDCRIDAEYTSRLVAAIEGAGALCGSATGLLIRARGEAIEPTDEIDSLGIRMTRNGRHFDLDQGVPLAASALAAATEPFEVFGVSGAAAMFRTRFLHETAVFGEALDEDFFAYREDADLSWRGRLMGWRAVCEPRAVAWHVRRVTPAARRELPADVNMHSVKNRFLLRLKNAGLWLTLRNAPFTLARDLVVLAAALTVERSSLPAFWWIVRNRSRIAAKRRQVQSRRVVSDRELARWFR